MTASVYTDFLKKYLPPGLSINYLNSVFAKHTIIIEWPACSPDKKPQEHSKRGRFTLIQGSISPKMISETLF